MDSMCFFTFTVVEKDSPQESHLLAGLGGTGSFSLLVD